MGYYRLRPQHALKAGVTTALCGLMAVGGLPTAYPTLAHYGLAAPVYADAAPQGKTVDINVVNADIRQVIGLLERQTGLDVVIQDTGQPFGTVTLTLTGATFEQALRHIVLSANASMTRTQDGTYVIRPGSAGTTASFDTPSMPDAAASDSQSSVPSAPPVAPKHDNMTWRTIELQHAIPSEILKIMHWDKDLVTIDPYNGSGARQLRNSITTTGNSINTNPFDGAPSVPIGRGDSGSADQANRSVDPNAQAQQAPGPPTIYPGGGYPGGGYEGGGYNGGGYNGGGYQRGGFNPGFQRGGGFQNNPFQQGGGPGGGQQAALPDGVDRIYALEGTNRLFVMATPDGFNSIRDIVKQLDIAPRQVQIKVEFVTSSVTDVDAFGINFDLVPYPGVEVSNNQGNQANISSTPQTFVQVASGNIVAQLYSSLVQGRGKVVQAPLITTTNNVPAYINVQTEIPYVTTTNVVGNNSTVSNTQQNFININTGLNVSPRINSDDTVTLNLTPVISDISGSPSITGGAPPITSQTLNTLRTVRNGETMVLGGLVRKSDTVSQSRMPILGDLPFIGQFFRNHVKNVDDSELLIFVTPTIIGESTDGDANSGGPNVTVAP